MADTSEGSAQGGRNIASNTVVNVDPVKPNTCNLDPVEINLHARQDSPAGLDKDLLCLSGDTVSDVDISGTSEGSAKGGPIAASCTVVNVDPLKPNTCNLDLPSHQDSSAGLDTDLLCLSGGDTISDVDMADTSEGSAKGGLIAASCTVVNVDPLKPNTCNLNLPSHQDSSAGLDTDLLCLSGGDTISDVDMADTSEGSAQGGRNIASNTVVNVDPVKPNIGNLDLPAHQDSSAGLDTDLLCLSGGDTISDVHMADTSEGTAKGGLMAASDTLVNVDPVKPNTCNLDPVEIDLPAHQDSSACPDKYLLSLNGYTFSDVDMVDTSEGSAQGGLIFASDTVVNVDPVKPNTCNLDPVEINVPARQDSLAGLDKYLLCFNGDTVRDVHMADTSEGSDKGGHEDHRGGSVNTSALSMDSGNISESDDELEGSVRENSSYR